MTEPANRPDPAVPPAAYCPLAGGLQVQEAEDEINLIDLFLVLVRNKFLIFWFVFIAGAGAVAISLMMTNIYQSSATITPKEGEKGAGSAFQALGGLGGMVAGQLGLGGSGSLEKLDVLLKSRYLTDRVVTKHNLLPVIFADMWNEEASAWETEEPPTLQDAYQAINENLLSVASDTTKGTITVGFLSPDPKTARDIVQYFLTELSDALREEILREAGENMRFFQDQLEQTADPLLREKIYAMLAAEIEKATFAKAQKYYSFVVLDPPVVPDPDREAKPNRKLICVLSVVVAFFLAVFAAFFREYGRRLKQEDPERYQEMAQGLKFWKRKKATA